MFDILKNNNLLNNSISKAIQIIPDHVFVVLGASANLIKSEIKKKKVNILINNNWDKGLGNSIGFGVNAISKTFQDTEGILVILADQPLIERDHYSSLIEGFTPYCNQIIATEYSDGKLGVPALFDKSYFKELRDLNSDFGAKHLIHKYSDNVKSIKNDHAIIDIDTNDQYDKLFKENHH